MQFLCDYNDNSSFSSSGTNNDSNSNEEDDPPPTTSTQSRINNDKASSKSHHCSTSKQTSSSSTTPINSTHGNTKNNSAMTTATQLRNSISTNHMFLRTKPHIVGNWCGHIYIDLETICSNNSSSTLAWDEWNQNSFQRLKQLSWKEIQLFQQQQKSLVIVPHIFMNSSTDDESTSDDTGDDEEVGGRNCKKRKLEDDDYPVKENRSGHISLSRQFYLQRHSIESFIHELKRHACIFQPFTLSFSSSSFPQSKILVNDEKTRSFLTLQATSNTTNSNHNDNPTINRLIRSIDQVLNKYGCPSYYEDPSIHVSIASCKGDIVSSLSSSSSLSSFSTFGKKKQEEFTNNIRSNQIKDDNSLESRRGNENSNPISFMVYRIQCDFGSTKKYTIPLSSL